MSNYVEISTFRIEFDAFEETPLTRKKCVGCGKDIDNKGTRSNGPKENVTCSYTCYRNFWLFKKTLGDLEEHPMFLAYLISLINKGKTIEQVKKIYKEEKKKKFEGPYELEESEDGS